jgi:hypothetical protein
MLVSVGSEARKFLAWSPVYNRLGSLTWYRPGEKMPGFTGITRSPGRAPPAIFSCQLLGGRNARRYRHCRGFRISDTGVGFCGCSDCDGRPLQIALQKSVRSRRLFGPHFTRARGMGVLLDLGVRVGPVEG